MCDLPTTAFAQTATKPVVTSMALAPGATSSDGAFIVTFNENVTGVDQGDFSLLALGGTSGFVSGLSPGDTPDSYRVAFSYSGATGSVQLAIKTTAAAITDGAGNAFDGTGSVNASPVIPNKGGTSDMTPPDVVQFIAGTPSASTVTFTLYFKEPVLGVATNAFVVSKPSGMTAVVGTPTGSGLGPYLVPVTFSGSGVLGLTVIGGATSYIHDTTGNVFAGGSAGVYSASVSISGGGVSSAGPNLTSATFRSDVDTADAGAGSVLDVTTNFDAPVSVTGAPSVGLTIGGVPKQAVYSYGGGSAAIHFYYHVARGDNGAIVIRSPIVLNAGTIRSSGNADAALTFTPPTTALIVDTTPPAAPTIRSITAPTATIDPGKWTFGGTAEPNSFVNIRKLIGGAFFSPIFDGYWPVDGNGAWTGSLNMSAPSGTYQFVAVALDAASNLSANSAVSTVTIDVPPGSVPPTIARTVTISGTVGIPMNYQIQAGGTPAPIFSILSADTMPFGLTLNRSGVVTGTPLVAGTSRPITLGVANSVGTTSFDLVVAVSAAAPQPPAVVPPPPTPPSTPPPPPKANQAITFAPAQGGIVGTAISLNAAASSGLPVSFALISGSATLSGNVLTPNIPGAIVVRAFNNGDPSTNGASVDATIIAVANQTISFVSPTSGFVIGQPIALSASSSASQPITFTLVSGNATLNGNVLTPKGPGAVVVRASSAGDAATAAASTDVNFGSPQKAPQAINFAALGDVATNAAPIPLRATTNSGLPLTFTVTGPATLTGATLTFTGAPGSVTVRATQAGNDSFDAAAAVTQTFNVRAIGQQVYFGTMGSDTLAAAVSQDGSHGTILVRIASTGEAIVATLKLNRDGTFTATTTTGQMRTLTGSFVNGVLTGSVAELNANFVANIQPPTGSTTAIAGLYVAAVTGSASGNTYLIVGPSGQTFALTIAGNTSAVGIGTAAATGATALSGGGTDINANVDASTGVLNGTITTAGGSTQTIAGLSDGMARTDRMVNASSRLRVAGGDASRTVIAGFVVSGSADKPILIRAVGPGLTAFGVSDVLATPNLSIFDATGKLVARNSGWNNDAVITAADDAVGAFWLAAGSKDSALSLTVAPGAYTAQVSSSDSGIVLLEVYDATAGAAASTQAIVNISTRGFVGTSDDQLVAGFVVTGNVPKRVLIRGIGPALAAFGVPGALSDPMLKVYAASNANAIAQNDNWGTPQPINATQVAATTSEISAAAGSAGAFPLTVGSLDAAIVITLAPGAYSAVESGVNGTTGAGLIEVYQISNP